MVNDFKIEILHFNTKVQCKGYTCMHALANGIVQVECLMHLVCFTFDFLSKLLAMREREIN